jgi:hypothetical protein
MTRVIKETSLHPHHWMNDFSCHLRFSEIHLITVLNASHRFVFQETPPPIKISHLVMRIPIVLYGTAKS